MDLVLSYPYRSSYVRVGFMFSHKTIFAPKIKLFQSVQRFTTASTSAKINEFQVKERRSANYHPSVWDPKFIESVTTSYSYEFQGGELDNLKQEVRKLLKTTPQEYPSVMLKLIDSMQRLGVAYHFEEEIKDALNLAQFHDFSTADLYTTSLQFRLRRDHGCTIGSEVFNKFKDRDGNFKEGLSKDAEGLMSLYEASHYGMQCEIDLEAARTFSVKHLNSLTGKMEIELAEQIQQSLECPVRWRMPRLEARNFIDLYESDSSRNPLLLEFAKLDYNLVQSVHQQEVQELAKWWKDLGLKEKLSFSRDRLMENYLWAMGMVSESHFSNCRKGLTKFVCILSAIDDMYDIYGSIDELERFTDAVNRWDVRAVDDLPDYMKICYLAMFNFGNEIAYNVLRDHGLNAVSCVKEEWANLCGAYLVEARWFYSGFIPTLEEYLKNAWKSVGGPAAIAHAYLLLGSPITKTSLDSFKASSELIYWSSIITRLSDDLGTYKDEIMRGDVAKSIQCYMNERSVTEEQARDHIKGLVLESWRKLNETIAQNSHPTPMISMSLNMARTAHCIYQHGDGIGTSFGVTKDRLTSLIVDPIPIERLTHGEVRGRTHSYAVENTYSISK
ncbi:probable terpene synthase 9 isoform X1 [Rhododendron vialii]|uniref:probable terpene synthase 9 isoform X1 n=1 Tax=Rhododendron vialii TaxID=182163 RepID=UPI00265D6F2D|nr:probable terpene synthase 9 isoform X1 [Rhododendron vialii]